jgi:hypothetical protein
MNPCGHSPYVTLSLRWGWVCRLQLLLALASAVILRSDFRGTHDHILHSQIWDSPNLEGQVPVFISPGTGWPSYTLRHWVPFSSLPTTRRSTVEVFEPVSTRACSVIQSKSKSKLLYDWRFNANQLDLASSPWDPQPEIFFQLNPCCNIISDEKMGSPLMNIELFWDPRRYIETAVLLLLRACSFPRENVYRAVA